jgi:nucleolar complex protein 3
VFRDDVTAHYSAVLLRLIARMIKERRYKVHPNVLSCLLALRLRSELSSPHESKNKARYNDKKPDETKVKSEIRKKWMNKNRRKAEKERQEVEKELQEASAEVDQEERSKVVSSKHVGYYCISQLTDAYLRMQQTETLKNLFVLYFSILKQPKRSPLLPAAMEGIAKFAHLVNIEFFRDLLKVLKNIIKGDGSMDDEDEEDFAGPDVVGKGIETRLRMLAIVTAFELLSGQGTCIPTGYHNCRSSLTSGLLLLDYR